LPHYTFWTHTQTDRPTDRLTIRWDKQLAYINSAYDRYIDSYIRVDINDGQNDILLPHIVQ